MAFADGTTIVADNSLFDEFLTLTIYDMDLIMYFVNDYYPNEGQACVITSAQLYDELLTIDSASQYLDLYIFNEETL